MSESDLQKLQRLNQEINTLKEKMELEADEKALSIGKFFIEFSKADPSKAESFLKFLDDIIEDKKGNKLAKRKDAKAIAEYISYGVSENK
ncbi:MULTISPECIES: hypothetical protein [unclassified Acinetobacter]|uniref:hypothetical protein n=1 Tax=unclassified Acinetobacter TaxID=196816 RepID=UPI0015D18BF5|nr:MULTISPECIES: hypothetical protein [unclassified Acinetobacter]UUS62511.1 hypothetical protein MST17_16795 [Acinetobacter sp. YH16056_T]